MTNLENEFVPQYFHQKRNIITPYLKKKKKQNPQQREQYLIDLT